MMLNIKIDTKIRLIYHCTLNLSIKESLIVLSLTMLLKPDLSPWTPGRAPSFSQPPSS